MPALNYTSSNFPFQPFTKIYSADVDQCFTDIQTLLNTTKLDATNIQALAVTTALINSQAVTLPKLDTTTVTPHLVPTGAVLAYVNESAAPTGFLFCNGSAVSRTTYAALFAVIGVTHGSGDGSTTFNIPDYLGRFLRCNDGGTGRDPDAASRTAMHAGGVTGNHVGSIQAAAFAAHTHASGSADPATVSTNYPSPSNAPIANLAGGADFGVSAYAATASTGGNETRPINAYVAYIIKT